MRFTVAMKSANGQFYYEHFSAEDAQHALEQQANDLWPDIEVVAIRIYPGREQIQW